MSGCASEGSFRPICSTMRSHRRSSSESVRVPDAFRPGGNDRTVKSRAQQTHLDEVVEMPGLERRILPVIGKAEQLLCLAFKLSVSTEPPHGRQREHGCRRATPSFVLHAVGELARLEASLAA